MKEELWNLTNELETIDLEARVLKDTFIACSDYIESFGQVEAVSNILQGLFLSIYNLEKNIEKAKDMGMNALGMS